MCTLLRFNVNTFDCIELNSFIRLVCIPYLMKHHSLLNGLDIGKFHETFVNKPISLENQQVLSWLGFLPEVECLPIATVKEWYDFVR